MKTSIVVPVIALTVIALGCSGSGADDEDTGRPVTRPTARGTAPAATPTTTWEMPADDPPTAGPTPAAKDITLTAKITDKDCYGSAGCNVSFRVALAYDGPELNPDETWLVTYEITGVDDGPEVGSLELTGTSFEAQEESVSTPSSKSKLRLKVTGVDTA